MHATTVAGDQLSFMMVADGHGGKEVAVYAERNLIGFILAEATDGSETALVHAMKAGFKLLHAHAQDLSFNGSGCTCTVIAINATRDLVVCANVGDTAAFLMTESDVQMLTDDHRLSENQAERDRVRSLGAKLGRAMNPETEEPSGPLRAWPGGLAIGRALGDRDCAMWLKAEPAVRTVPLPAAGAEIVLCSDGVWDAIGLDKVNEITTSDAHPIVLAKSIVKAAIKERGLRDDTTCVYARISPDGAPPRRPPASGLRGALSRLGIATKHKSMLDTSGSSLGSSSTENSQLAQSHHTNALRRKESTKDMDGSFSSSRMDFTTKAGNFFSMSSRT